MTQLHVLFHEMIIEYNAYKVKLIASFTDPDFHFEEIRMLLTNTSLKVLFNVKNSKTHLSNCVENKSPRQRPYRKQLGQIL